MEADQLVMYKRGVFVGKGYSCDGMFKLNVEINDVSVYIASSVNLWHDDFVMLIANMWKIWVK